jgi:hypothetical protein
MLRFVAGLPLLLALGAYGREIVIFDTDSGLFGDDGAALVMLLRSPAQAAAGQRLAGAGRGVRVSHPGPAETAAGARVYRRGKTPGE